MYCVVRDCRSVWNPKSSLIFHGFPRDPEKRCRWLSRIPLKGNFYETAKVCSLHFKAEHCNPANPKRLLMDAIPFYAGRLPCLCDARVKSCTLAPYECSESPDVKLPTESDIFTVPQQQQTSFGEKDAPGQNILLTALTLPTHCKASGKLLNPLPESSGTGHLYFKQVVDENEPPAKRRSLKDFTAQCNIKSSRERALENKIKVLMQKVTRSERKIKELSSQHSSDKHNTNRNRKYKDKKFTRKLR